MKIGHKKTVVKYSQFMYKSLKCKECGEDIEWQIEPDFDPYWFGTCACEDGQYSAEATEVKIQWESN
jgi:hypothetical protein